MYVFSPKAKRSPFFEQHGKLSSLNESMGNDQPLAEPRGADGSLGLGLSSGKETVKPNNKTRRGYGKKKNRNKRTSNKLLSIFGINCNSIAGKVESLINNINYFEPSIVTLQETKLRKSGNIRINGYQIFERIRDTNGGGLMTMADMTLDPVVTHVGENEVLTVEVNIDGIRIRNINAYGPQEDANENVLLSF